VNIDDRGAPVIGSERGGVERGLSHSGCVGDVGCISD
jgi:hypothetical protein